MGSLSEIINLKEKQAEGVGCIVDIYAISHRSV